MHFFNTSLVTFNMKLTRVEDTFHPCISVFDLYYVRKVDIVIGYLREDRQTSFSPPMHQAAPNFNARSKAPRCFVVMVPFTAVLFVFLQNNGFYLNTKEDFSTCLSSKNALQIFYIIYNVTNVTDLLCFIMLNPIPVHTILRSM